MRPTVKKQVIYAWVMLMSLMPVFVVKTLHYHERNEVFTEQPAADSSHASHSLPCDQCPVCHFAFSPFEEASQTVLHAYFTLINTELQQPLVERSSNEILTSLLRAPPYSSVA